jgi:deoxyribonuclease-4
MGKHSQFGTLEEVLKLSKHFGIYPTVDFAHMHARANGGYNSAKEFHQILDTYEEYLGKGSLGTMHMHYSGIEYTEKGERKHLPLKESDANWKALMEVLKEREVGGVLVCESPIQEIDVMLLESYYGSL